MIRPFSGSRTAVHLPPEHRDATKEWPMGCQASSRTTVCFELKHGLFRVESNSASSRTTLREACAVCTSAMVPWHETYRTGLPEGRMARKTGHIARSPSIGSTRSSSRWWVSTARVRDIGYCRYRLPERLVWQATARVGFPY